MKSRKVVAGLRVLMCGCGLLATAAVGCQSDIAGQTLPSAYYLRDDVQFFVAGPETPLINQRRAIEEYRAGRQAAGAFAPGAPPPQPGNPLP